MAAPHPQLHALLDALGAHFDHRWLDSDPLRWPRTFADPDDREVVAVIAALLAYGRVASIHRAIADVLARLGPRPAEALAPARRARLDAALDGFRHRFTAGPDVAWLLRGVAAARDTAGSLGAFVAAHATGPEPLRAGLASWRRLADGTDPTTDPVRRRARRFLLADPEGGAACKRSLLLARWCVRPDDGLDLGLWTHGPLRPRDLLLPLDTHVHRTVRDLGLTRRAVADWRCAAEVTARLAAFDPDDPVRYDFALARPGIAGGCRHRHVPAVCGGCALVAACRHGAGPRRAATSGRRTRGLPRTTPARAPSCRTPDR